MSGYTIRIRGGSSLVSRDYQCATCDVTFDDTVTNPPPATIVCPVCSGPAQLTISAPAVHTLFTVGVTRGRNDAKPHPDAMDTRAIAEGQPIHEWKAERKKVWEQDRKRRLKEMLR